MRFLSLFSGIGGIDLGLERAGMTCIGQVEIEPFPRAVLAKHWPEVFRWSDICDLPTELVRYACGTPDLIAGGFACQDVSAAGKGAGIGRHTRSGLTWRNLFRLARGLRPRWLLIENVPALRTRGADRVIGALERIGYACWPVVVGAWAAGAPHKRDRVWIVAHLQGRRDRDGMADAKRGELRQQRERARGEWSASSLIGGGSEVIAEGLDNPAGPWPSRPGELQHEWEAPRLVELPLGGELNGVPVRLVRAANRHALKCYGNSAVPQVVEEIGRIIVKIDKGICT
jgi:DNA (cytosine-5)-methyltransferase 1